MEFFRVQRKGEVELIRRAIEASGGRLLTPIDPTRAPFEMKVETATGQVLDLVCYAFHANKYRQTGRPADEHRFQVKYGSDFQRYHEIFIDPSRRRTTLFFGVHVEAGVFVAVDPAMHNPTWFSRSVEFKDEHVATIQRSGWHCWERERSSGRRKRELPLVNQQTEILVGFKPDNFLRFAQLETLATGLDAGSRMLLAERTHLMSPSSPLHPLEKELGLSAWKLLDVVEDRFRLKVAVRGGVAEVHLARQLSQVSGVDEVTTLDEDGKPDLRIVYRGRDPVFVECKNVLKKMSKSHPKVDFQKTRAAKGDPCSRYYRASDFEILAACLFPISEAWEFNFCQTRALAPHEKCVGKLSQSVLVGGPGWTNAAEQVLDEASRRSRR